MSFSSAPHTEVSPTTTSSSLLLCCVNQNLRIMRAGDIVFVSEPFARVLEDHLRGSLCDHCFEPIKELQRCNGCQFVCYCNKDCQAKDWNLHHQFECSNLRKKNNVSSDIRLIARIIMRLRSLEHMESEKIVNDATKNFYDLMNHINFIKNDARRMEEFGVVCEELKQFIGENSLPTNKILLDIYGKVRINRMSIESPAFGIIGNGLYLAVSALDHSCQPNCCLVFRGTTVQVRLLEDVANPSVHNLFITYTDLLQGTRDRQMVLKENYYFDCNCNRCTDATLNAIETSIVCFNGDCKVPVPFDAEYCWNCNTPTQNSTEKATDAMSRLEEAFKQLKVLEDQNDMETAFTVIVKEIDENTILHPLNCHYVKLLNNAFASGMALNKTDYAVGAVCRMLEACKKYYGKNHPSVGLHLMKLANIYFTLSRLDIAKSYIDEAVLIVQLMHPVSSPLYRMVEKKRAMIEAQIRLNRIG